MLKLILNRHCELVLKIVLVSGEVVLPISSFPSRMNRCFYFERASIIDIRYGCIFVMIFFCLF